MIKTFLRKTLYIEAPILLPREVTLMQNCNYNKTRLLADVKSMLWRIKQYYKKDATDANHPLCGKMVDELEKDLAKYADKLQAAIGGLSKEGKFS